ncbi:hypothetical protein BSKO_08628 [Bryopsis sp. KO-2023]|nr:hypothetical protein BSKO_08628 [Bryopsis sp. KO-2023]
MWDFYASEIKLRPLEPNASHWKQDISVDEFIFDEGRERTGGVLVGSPPILTRLQNLRASSLNQKAAATRENIFRDEVSNGVDSNAKAPRLDEEECHEVRGSAEDEKASTSFTGGDVVPTIFCGDVCTSSLPSKVNEADARLVLRMAMTGETIGDLSQNLKNTYGPSMDLGVLLKLMTADQVEGKTLFYVNENTLRSAKASSSSDAKTGGGFSSTTGASWKSCTKSGGKEGGGFWHPSVIAGKISEATERVSTALRNVRPLAGIKSLGSRLKGTNVECRSIGWMSDMQARHRYELQPAVQDGGSVVESETPSQSETTERSHSKRGFGVGGIGGRMLAEAFPAMGYFMVASRMLGWDEEGQGSGSVNNETSPTIGPMDSTTGGSIPRVRADPAKMSDKDAWVVERIPLEAAFRLLMRSRDKYRLVVDDQDVEAVREASLDKKSEKETPQEESPEAPPSGTPMFAIRGLEVSLDTTKGPVNFVPLFFSKKELQLFYTMCRDTFKMMWLMHRSEKREEKRTKFETQAASFGGVTPGITPVSNFRARIEDSEDDDGLGDGDPAEVREFMEELGEAGGIGEVGSINPSSFPPLPTMLVLGVVSVATGIWKLGGDMMDLFLMHSPLEPFLLGLPHRVPHNPLFLESCIKQFSALNGETSLKAQSSETIKQPIEETSAPPMDMDALDLLEKPATKVNDADSLSLESLKTLQTMVRGVWQLVTVLRHAPASMMMVGSHIATQEGANLPDIHDLRRSNTNVSVSTTIHIDEEGLSARQKTDDMPAASPRGTPIKGTSFNMGLVFNLSQAFDSSCKGDLVPLTSDPVAMGIWMVGNLGVNSSESPPPLGFGNIRSLKDGLPIWNAGAVLKEKSSRK